MLLIESVLAVLAVIGALPLARFASKQFAEIDWLFIAIARHRSLSAIGVGILAIGLRLSFLPLLPIPEPVVHDEFGYLLAAETFAHGRLTNSTHPMWAHFETFSIIQRPTYQCFAQPAQGLILAAGTLIFGHPYWGVLLSMGLMCWAICWMLQAWVPSRWALLGGLLAVVRYGTLTYWANSYWGGGMGALGGALVLGALPRIKRTHPVRNALIMALGLAIMAANRPFEGFVISLPVAIALFWWIFGKHGPPFTLALRSVILPICFVLLTFAATMGYYCWRVTGSPFQLPYQLERKEYAVVPYLAWQRLKPEPVYHSEMMREVYAHDEVAGYFFFRSSMGLLAKFVWTWRFFLGPALTLPVLLALISQRQPGRRVISRRTKFLLATYIVVMAGMALETFWSPHYISPSTCVLLALVMIAMRRVSQWRWNERMTGVSLIRGIFLVCVSLFVVRVVHGPLRGDQFYAPAWYQQGLPSFGREAIIHQIDRIPGQQLVVVRYSPAHNPLEEWVYNHADIDASEIVWARELSPAENRSLFSYFHDRRAWLLEADRKPPHLCSYPALAPDLGCPTEQSK